MAVQNYFTNYGVNPNPELPGHVVEKAAIEFLGIQPGVLQKSATILATDQSGSTYILFKDVPSDMILYDLDLEIDAIPGFTSCSVGIYDSDTGVALAANCYMNAVDVHVGANKQVPIDGLSALTHDQTLQRIRDLLNLPIIPNGAKGRYDIVLTANTLPGNAGGVVTGRALLIQAV